MHKREGVPRLFVVTNGATDTVGDHKLDLGQAILHGMSRVIRNESPNVPLTVIDLSATIPTCEIETLCHELLHTRRDQDESEIVLRGDQRFLRQLVPVDRDSAEKAATTEEPGCGGFYRAELTESGGFDHVVFRRLQHSDPQALDVEIAVEAAGVNFKDIMNVMGMLPENAVAGGLTEKRLGLEIAGRVLRKGSLVQHVEVGDNVIACVAEGFCGRVTTPGHYVVRCPGTLTPVQAAAVPLSYVTAWYSLWHLARLARGETVLIHSGAGGVGGAAIQLARRAGAKVIATAGTKEKRDYLRQIGIETARSGRIATT